MIVCISISTVFWIKCENINAPRTVYGTDSQKISVAKQRDSFTEISKQRSKVVL